MSCLALDSKAAIDTPIDTLGGYFGGVYNDFSEEVGDVPGNRYHFNFEFNYHKKKPEQTERKLTFATLVNDQNLTMVSVQEAYAAHHWGRSILTYGRHILPWSMVDANWGFGKLNNRRNFDFFEPGVEGLVGLSFSRRYSSGIEFDIFGSPIYVPELSPSLDIDNGDKTIKSRHAWGNPPAATAEVENGLQKVIRYDVEYPELWNVISRGQIGGRLAYKAKHLELNGFYIYKPENSLSQQVDVSYNAGDDVINARIYPQVFYHHVYGANAIYQNQDLQIYFSGIAIRPNTFPDGDFRTTRFTEIKTAKIREDYAGAGINKSNDVYSVGLGYVARLSPFDRTINELAAEPRWNQAVNAFLKLQLNTHFNLSADVKYDTMTTDRLIMFKALWAMTKKWTLTGGIHIIGTPGNGKSYWSPYTNNDAAYMGLRYIF